MGWSPFGRPVFSLNTIQNKKDKLRVGADLVSAHNKRKKLKKMVNLVSRVTSPATYLFAFQGNF